MSVDISDVVVAGYIEDFAVPCVDVESCDTPGLNPESWTVCGVHSEDEWAVVDTDSCDTSDIDTGDCDVLGACTELFAVTCVNVTDCDVSVVIVGELDEDVLGSEITLVHGDPVLLMSDCFPASPASGIVDSERKVWLESKFSMRILSRESECENWVGNDSSPQTDPALFLIDSDEDKDKLGEGMDSPGDKVGESQLFCWAVDVEEKYLELCTEHRGVVAPFSADLVTMLCVGRFDTLICWVNDRYFPDALVLEDAESNPNIFCGLWSHPEMEGLLIDLRG